MISGGVLSSLPNVKGSKMGGAISGSLSKSLGRLALSAAIMTQRCESGSLRSSDGMNNNLPQRLAVTENFQLISQSPAAVRAETPEICVRDYAFASGCCDSDQAARFFSFSGRALFATILQQERDDARFRHAAGQQAQRGAAHARAAVVLHHFDYLRDHVGDQWSGFAAIVAQAVDCVAADFSGSDLAALSAERGRRCCRRGDPCTRRTRGARASYRA